MNERTRNSGMVLGEVASSGLARGTAVLCACANRITVARRVISSDEVEAEMVKLDAAIAIVEEELMDLQKKVQQSLGDQSAGIFEAHIALLRAPSLRKAIRAGCLDRQINVEAAVEESIEKLASTFAQMEDPYLRERAADLEDIGNRLLAVLTKNQPSEKPAFPQGSVLVTSELLPSVTARLDSETIRGVIVEKGGQTAHATILARELGVPLLIGVPDAMKRIRTGDRLIVDGWRDGCSSIPLPTSCGNTIGWNPTSPPIGPPCKRWWSCRRSQATARGSDCQRTLARRPTPRRR